MTLRGECRLWECVFLEYSAAIFFYQFLLERVLQQVFQGGGFR